MEIKATRHIIYQIAYHLVWVTKYRTSVLTLEMGKELTEILRETAKEHTLEIMAVEVEPEHVHCFVNAPPKMSPSSIVKITKRTSVCRMFQKFPSLKEKLYKGHLWHASSYLGTAGNVSAETIKKYIENQRQHHQ